MWNIQGSYKITLGQFCVSAPPILPGIAGGLGLSILKLLDLRCESIKKYRPHSKTKFF